MKQVNLYLVLIIIFLVLILGFVVYTYYSDYQRAKENLADRIISAHLERFPAGTKIEEGMKGEEKTIFKQGEWLGVVGEIKTKESGKLSFEIFDLNDNLIATKDIWQMSTKEGQGSFGMCCIVVPNEAGQFKLSLFFNDNLMKNLNFSVTE